jgi:hypothetical protein
MTITFCAAVAAATNPAIATCRDANKTKARHNSSAAPQIDAVLRTPMMRNRIK